MTTTVLIRKVRQSLKRIFTPPVTKAIINEMWVSYATFILLFVWMVLDLWGNF